MKSRNDIVQARVNHDVKLHAKEISQELGLTLSDAINLFLIQYVKQQGLPFPVRIPNAETRKVFAEADAGKNLHKAKDVDDLFDQLNS